ncbi:MAG: RidA family protein [Candidatus Tectomicrobia bacterium]|uniref:RidA family protein n=1 Tax=Tectimicrobiota bacterium TaxID=2528274 RepID=A0A938B376_UNCTE|nr:RidA family protein [Candidatus Tectomicrobia bacterium]
MPNITHLNPDTMSQPRGFSNVVKAGNTVYIAGQVAGSRDGSVVGKGDAEAQVRQIWHNIEAAVKSVGGTLHNVVKTTTYVTSLNHAGAVRKVREELFPSNPPTSTLLVVSGLASPDYLVEIEAIAVVDA